LIAPNGWTTTEQTVSRATPESKIEPKRFFNWPPDRNLCAGCAGFHISVPGFAWQYSCRRALTSIYVAKEALDSGTAARSGFWPIRPPGLNQPRVEGSAWAISKILAGTKSGPRAGPRGVECVSRRKTGRPPLASPIMGPRSCGISWLRQRKPGRLPSAPPVPPTSSPGSRRTACGSQRRKWKSRQPWLSSRRGSYHRERAGTLPPLKRRRHTRARRDIRGVAGWRTPG
jgi:hypothetical protein